MSGKLIEIFIDMAEITSTEQPLYNELLKKIIYELKKRLRRYPEILETENIYLKEELSGFESATNCMEFREGFKDIFKEIKEAGWHTLITLDEFDSSLYRDKEFIPIMPLYDYRCEFMVWPIEYGKE